MNKKYGLLVDKGVYHKDGIYTVVTTAKSYKTGQLVKIRSKKSDRLTSLEQAQAWRDQKQAAARGDDQIVISRPIFADYLVEWNDRQGDIDAPSTRELTSLTIRDHILPDLGSIYIDQLNRTDIKGWVKRVELKTQPNGGSYADATVKRWFSLLCTILKDCAVDHNIPDLTRRIKPPKINAPLKREQYVPTLEEAGQILMWIWENRFSRFAEAVFMAFTGLRDGEIYGAKWDDIEGSRLTLVRRRSGGKLVPGLKNAPSRVVYLVDLVLGALQVHRKQMIMDQHPGLASGLLFPNRDGGVRGRGTMRKIFNAACDALGFEFRITPQVWRRAFNTWMLEGKTDTTVLHAMIGHSDMRQTRRYASVHLEAKSQSVHQSLDTLLVTMDQIHEARN